MRVLFILGTRPEAVKLAPVIKIFNDSDKFDVRVCSTGQHREMLQQVLDFFGIKPDYKLDVMTDNQSLFGLTSRILTGLEEVLNDYNPNLIFTQGDTTTAFVGALAGFYKKIKIAHVEAGLRSFNKYSPFPEEINRVLVDHLSDYLFAPTRKAKQNLLKEGINENIHVVGNTVIDALFLTLNIIKNKGKDDFYKRFPFLDFKKRILLITAHRRESFGKPFKNICEALREIAQKFKNVEIVYPVHLNPNVRRPVFAILKDVPNVHLIEPLNYPEFVWLMNKSYFVVTDSGGVQEEAPSLGKPVLVIRDVTERTEGINAGTAKLIGTDKSSIVQNVALLLNDKEEYDRMARAVNPYGDGKASNRILEVVKENLL